MTAVLHTEIDILVPIAKLRQRRGLIELSDAQVFTLRALDSSTNTFASILMEAPISQLTVKGDRSMLTFVSDGKRQTVDFSLSSRAVGWIGGIGGAIGQAAVLKTTDIQKWLDGLRGLGVQVKYRSIRRYYLVWSLGAFLFLVAIVVGFALLANAVTYRV